MAALNPTPYIWKNGEFIAWDEAQTHVLSHGLHYGTGYFEGIRAYECKDGSSVFRLDEHMKRLVNSGKILALPCPYDADTLSKATIELLQKNKLKSAYIRPLAYVGYGSLGVHPGKDPKIDVIIAAWSWGAYLGEEGLAKGISLCTSSFARHHVNSMMTKAKAAGNYVNSVLSKVEAVNNGYDEAMVLDTQGFVSEATGENIFIVRGNTIKTTPLTSILEGITRNALIQVAKDLGYEVVEQQFTRDEVYIADEMFCTGTAAEVTPVRMVDNRQIGIGKAGPITQKIQKAFFELVKGDNKKYEDWLNRYSI